MNDWPLTQTETPFFPPQIKLPNWDNGQAVQLANVLIGVCVFLQNNYLTKAKNEPKPK